MPRSFRSLRRLALIAAPLALLAACGGGGDLEDRLDLADPRVRLVHAVPFAPNVTLFRNDSSVGGNVTNVPYRSASNYFDVSTATERWDVRTATTPAVNVGSVTFDARRGNKYTLIAVPTSGSLTEVALINDPYNKGIASDNARVRVFNAAFNAGGLDVYLTPTTTTDITNVTPTYAAVPYKAASPVTGQDSVQLEGGAYRLRITPAGSKTVIFTAPVNLAKNADWLVMPVPGSLAPADLRVLVVQSDSSSPATELSNSP